MKVGVLRRGFTLLEILTALVVVAVLAAIAVPMWRNHQLRVQRSDAIAALMAVQEQQDAYFGRHARYADGAQLAAAKPGGLGLSTESRQGYFDLELRSSADGLGYVATARAAARKGQTDDARCVSFTLDHNGVRRAVDSAGNDRSADCWR
jgi:type IV pilus assembly protein PilE